jgi:DnaD/phage-associated family protein
MEIYLNNGHTFPVPVAVADHLLGLASHDQLKVLLYVLCHADEALTQEQIAKSCKVLPAAVEEALVFWQDANVLTAAPAAPSVRLVRSTEIPVPQPPAPVQTVQPAAPAKPAAHLQNSSRPNLTPGQIAERMKKNKALKEMFDAVQGFTGEMPNNVEQNSLLWMHEYLGLPPDVILMLAAFCKQINSYHVRYMEKIAIEWQERGITTHQLAQEDITRRTEARSYTGRIKVMFQMKRDPTPKQQEYIDGWQKSGFSPELVQLAYEKARDKKGDEITLESIRYIDGILRRWKAAGIRTPEAAAKEDADYYAAKKRKTESGNPAVSTAKSTANSSIDMNEVEKLMNPL